MVAFGLIFLRLSIAFDFKDVLLALDPIDPEVVPPDGLTCYLELDYTDGSISLKIPIFLTQLIYFIL